MTKRITTIAALLLFAGSLHAQVIPASKPIVIPQQTRAVVTPGPWQSNDKSQPQMHAGSLGGKSQYETVYLFDKAIRGQFIKTEGFGTDKPGQFWNQNNTAGDRTQKSVLCAYAHDFTIDGRAEFRPYPWAYTDAWKAPDIHGPDMPWRADGLAMQGAGSRAEHLRFFNIPGTALVMRDGKGPQAAFYGTWDLDQTVVDDIHVLQAINGVDIRCGDAKIGRVFINSVSKDGLTLDINGGTVAQTHVQGADVSCRILSEAHFGRAYHESARIGTVIESNAHNCTFDLLQIGPGTCSEIGVLIKPNGCTIPISGGVKTGAVGAHCLGASNNIRGNLQIESGAVGVKIEGNGGTLDLTTFQPNGGTAVLFPKPATPAGEKPAPITGWTITLRIHGYHEPVAVDCQAPLVNCKIHILTMGEPVKNLGNIPAGNEVWIDGVLQVPGKAP